MPLAGVHADPRHRNLRRLQVVDEPALLGWLKGPIGVDAENEVTLVAAAGEELLVGTRMALGHEVKPLPGIEDAQVGICIEASGKFLPLVKHVRLHRMIDLIPAERRSGHHDLASRPLPEVVE